VNGADPFEDEPSKPSAFKIEEMRVEDMLLAFLRSAKNGLRRKSIDEVNELFAYAKNLAKHFDRSRWPAEVLRFMSRFRRPRGRMRSRQADLRRFWANPNRVAALLATERVRSLQMAQGKRRYKIRLSDGSTSTVSGEAVRRAVTTVNKSNRFGTRRADKKQVAHILARGKRRVNPPRDPFDNDLNPPNC
jgi:hypothetical protein